MAPEAEGRLNGSLQYVVVQGAVLVFRPSLLSHGPLKGVHGQFRGDGIQGESASPRQLCVGCQSRVQGLEQTRDLETCSQVLIRVEASQKPLYSPYKGPFKVLE